VTTQTCPDCRRTWVGYRSWHCSPAEGVAADSACHNTFSGQSVARLHRPGITCLDPAGRGLVFDGKRGLWTIPGGVL
jgi:hypothetical protein